MNLKENKLFDHFHELTLIIFSKSITVKTKLMSYNMDIVFNNV